MIKGLKMLLSILLFSISPISSLEESCYATNLNPYQRMGQKTSYFINENLDDSEISVDGCEPAMLWYLGRHGSRKPSRGEIEDYGSRLPDLQQRIVSAGLLGTEYIPNNGFKLFI